MEENPEIISSLICPTVGVTAQPSMGETPRRSPSVRCTLIGGYGGAQPGSPVSLSPSSSPRAHNNFSPPVPSLPLQTPSAPSLSHLFSSSSTHRLLIPGPLLFLAPMYVRDHLSWCLSWILCGRKLLAGDSLGGVQMLDLAPPLGPSEPRCVSMLQSPSLYLLTKAVRRGRAEMDVFTVGVFKV